MEERTNQDCLKRNKERDSDSLENQTIVHVLNDQAIPGDNKCALLRIFQPISIGLMCFGLVWKKPSSSGRNHVVDIHTVYCCFTLTVFWFAALHYCVLYGRQETFSGELVMKLVPHMFCVQYAACATAFVYFHNKHFLFFLRLWDNYKLKYGGVPLPFMRKHVFRRATVINCITFVLFSVYAVLTFVIPRGTRYEQSHRQLAMPLIKYVFQSQSYKLEVFYTVTHGFANMAFMQTIIVVTTICSLLAREFKQLAWELNYAISGTRHLPDQDSRAKLCHSEEDISLFYQKRSHPNEVEQFRLRNVDLAYVVTRLDDALHGYLLFLYLIALPLVVLMLFGISGYREIMYENDPVTTLRGVVGVVCYTVIIASVGLSGTALAETVCPLFTKKTETRLGDVQIV